MPARYDPEVDGWWGVILTELGLLDPFREENRSCLLVKFLCVTFFALFLCALSLCSAYKNIRKQRDDAREDSTKGASKCDVLDNKLKDAMIELCYANERLQDADNGMDDERKEFRDTIQELNDQHLVNEETIRSLKQDLSNTECDCEEYERKLSYASQKSQELAWENQKLEREKQQLEASLAENENTINDLQAHKNDSIPEPVAAVTPTSIYTQPHDDIETDRPVTTILTLKDPAIEEATADEEETDAHGIEFENRCDAHAKSGERLEKKVSAKDDELAERDGRIKDLEQQNGSLTTDFEKLRDEHGECSGKLAGKVEEIKELQAGKTTADNESAETIAGLRKELQKKGQEVEELEAEGTSSADAVQRVSTLSAELEASRLAHAQCDEKSTGQISRIDELGTEKEQLEGALRVKKDEIGQVNNDLKELQETHAKCGEHANTQASEMTALRNANKSLQDSNTNLSREVELARLQNTNLVGEGQQVLNQYEALQNLHSTSQGEVRSLQVQLHTRNQTIEHQKQRIQTLETNCPKCQKLREALDEVVKDVEMSDDSTRDEMRKEITDSVRAELRSQVPNDLRRQIRGDIEREVRAHYSDLFARNTSRIREQDRLLLEKDTTLKEARNAPTVDHAARKRRQANLESKITRLEQDTNMARGNYSRLNNEAKQEREQLKRAQTASENLRNELEKIKADQRRAQNINPLQGKLTTFQRELDSMKADRNKARDNCSTYSKLLSDLRKKHEALQSECAAFRGKSSLDGDSVMDDGRTEEAIAVQNEQRTAVSSDTDKSTVIALHNEVARLSKELEEWKARDKVRHPAMGNTLPGNQGLPVDEGEQQWPEGSFPDDQSSAVPAMDRDEVAALDLLRHELDVREARDGKKKASGTQPVSNGPTVKRSADGSSLRSAQDSDDEKVDKSSVPIDGGEKSDDELEEGEILDTKLTQKPARKFGRRLARQPARQPTSNPVLGGLAGRKREHDEFSDGEADDEGGDDRKKVKIASIEDGMHRLRAED